MMANRLAQLVGTDGTVPPGAAELRAEGLTADSRKAGPGLVFAALPGTKVDGARFIPQALAQGALAVVAQKGAYSGPGVVIETDNPRRLYALMAARLAGPQPDNIVAVTGTNGKTSVAAFVRQIWSALGFRAASLGTIGVVGPSGAQYLSHTTPDPIELHRIAADLKADHVDHLAIEASSHGLDQFRLDGLRLAAGGFTNLTRDHMDYHPTVAAYFDAKMRLFEELLPKGAPAVINVDAPYGAEAAARAGKAGLSVYTVGRKGTHLRLVADAREGMMQVLTLATASGTHRISLPLAGAFQAANALVAAGLVLATGGEESQVLHALESLKGAPGRLEQVGQTAAGGAVFVDYAHTPDALDNAILALKPYATGRMVVVFGCGGDRDKGKRPQMGAIAHRLAQRVIVTDDNPRTETPAMIRAEILAAAPGAEEIGDRAAAIRAGVRDLGAGDVLLVAGKGHEPGQTVGTEVRPFSDHDAVRAAIAGEDYHG